MRVGTRTCNYIVLGRNRIRTGVIRVKVERDKPDYTIRQILATRNRTTTTGDLFFLNQLQSCMLPLHHSQFHDVAVRRSHPDLNWEPETQEYSKLFGVPSPYATTIRRGAQLPFTTSSNLYATGFEPANNPA